MSRFNVMGFFSTSGSSGTSSSASMGLQYFKSGRAIVVAVATDNVLKTVSSITLSVGSATFTKVGSVILAAQNLEIWVGYNVVESALSNGITINFSQSTGAYVWYGIVFDCSADLTSTPTVSINSGSTGTSTSADSGLITPTAGDLIVVAATWASAGSSSSARTPTGHTFIFPGELSSSALFIAIGIAPALNATPSKQVWTITSALWTALAGKITFAADPSPVTALVPKGLTTAALDAASSF